MGAQHPCYFSEVAQQQTTHHHDSYKVSLQHQHSKTHIQYKGVELAIECTYTDPRTGEVFPIAVNPDNPDTISAKMIDEGVSMIQSFQETKFPMLLSFCPDIVEVGCPTLILHLEKVT